MTIYELTSKSNEFEGLTLNDQQAVIINDLFVGKSIMEIWEPPTVQITKSTSAGEKLKKGDFPSWAGVPVFSKKAVDALDDFLLPNGELLPINCRDSVYFAYNVTSVLDVLAEANSAVVRFSSGRILRIEKYSFLWDKVAGLSIFKIPQTERSIVYVTSTFVNRIEATGLLGMSVRPVWPD